MMVSVFFGPISSIHELVEGTLCSLILLIGIHEMLAFCREATIGWCLGIRYCCKTIWMEEIGTWRRRSASMHVRPFFLILSHILFTKNIIVGFFRRARPSWWLWARSDLLWNLLIPRKWLCYLYNYMHNIVAFVVNLFWILERMGCNQNFSWK